MLAPQRLGVLVGVLLCAAIAPKPAQAVTYCVQDPNCVGTSATLQQALTAAAGSSADDIIQIGPVTLSGTGFRYAPGADGGQLTIQGAGAAQTTLTGVGQFSSDVLEVDEDASNHVATVRDLGFQVPQGSGYTQGLTIARGLVQRVQATSPGTTGYPIGLRISDGTVVRDSVLDLGTTGFAGVEMVGSPTTVESRLEDSTAIARWGILVESGPGAVTRTRVQAVQEGIEACNTEADVDNTVIELGSKYTIGLAVQAGGRCGSGAALIQAKHVTIVGGGFPAVPGVGAVQVFANAYAASIDLRHSIIRNVATTLAWDSTNSATATIGSTDADLSAGAQYGTPGTMNLLPGNINVDPRFVDAAAGDYRLQANSPAIDAGPSEMLAIWESPLDLAGNSRIVDGNGDGVAARDMGAIEFQPHKPGARAAASRARLGRGQPFRFSAQGSSDPDPGDVLRFRWSFDDGTSASGMTVSHAFRHAGKHHAKLTVIDLAGLRASATVTVTVTPRCIVPRLKGLTLGNAKHAIRVAGCTVGTVGLRASRQIPAGHVISQHPTRRKNLPPGSAVDLVVSSG